MAGLKDRLPGRPRIGLKDRLPAPSTGGGPNIKPGTILGVAMLTLTAWILWDNWVYLLAVIGGRAPIFGMPFPVFAFQAIALVLGFLFIPLIAFMFGPALPGAIAEPIVNWLMNIALLRWKDIVFDQRETDEYVLEPAPDGLGPASYWDRWAGSNLGLTFEATSEAFASTADESRRQQIENLEYVDEGDTAEIPDFNRGGYSWFAHKSDQAADILVPIGRKLSELRDAAGPDIAIEAYAEALKDYGGDTSEFSNKMMIVGSAFFTGMGLLMGYVVFF